jgi:hypothetical protein
VVVVRRRRRGFNQISQEASQLAVATTSWLALNKYFHILFGLRGAAYL